MFPWSWDSNLLSFFHGPGAASGFLLEMMQFYLTRRLLGWSWLRGGVVLCWVCSKCGRSTLPGFITGLMLKMNSSPGHVILCQGWCEGFLLYSIGEVYLWSWFDTVPRFIKELVTARVHSTTGGYVFTGVCLLTLGGYSSKLRWVPFSQGRYLLAKVGTPWSPPANVGTPWPR